MLPVDEEGNRAFGIPKRRSLRQSCSDLWGQDKWDGDDLCYLMSFNT